MVFKIEANQNIHKAHMVRGWKHKEKGMIK